MKDKICCFAGHKDIYGNRNIQFALYKKCEELIIKKYVNCFLVGNYGGFDEMASGTVIKLKEKYPHIKLELVLPYTTQKIDRYKDMYYKMYDSIIIADVRYETPAKFKILRCNQYMVDNSDFLIAYISHTFGGAAKTYEYALKKGKEVFNLADSIK